MASSRRAKFAVRDAVERDAAAIAAAHVEGWRSAYEDIVPDSYLAALDVAERTRHWVENLRGETQGLEVDRPTNFVAEQDGEVVGFACVGELRAAPQVEAGELWAMYIHPAAWGIGAGSALMARTLELFAMENRQHGYLWVLSENDAGRGFYEHHGWTVDDADGSRQSFEIDGVSIEELRYHIAL